MNFLLAPGPETAHFGPPEKKSLCASFPGKEDKKGPTRKFSGGFLGQKGGPKRAIFGHQKVLIIYLIRAHTKGSCNRTRLLEGFLEGSLLKEVPS